jgi:segregation and condensation protein B
LRKKEKLIIIRFRRVWVSVELKKEVESLLFSSGKMMKEKELAELTNSDEKEVREALEALKKEYDERDTSLVFMNSGDSWKLNVREKYIGLVTKIISDTELPFPVLETLGVIAFKAPAMQADIIKARGTNAYEHVAVLVETGFVEKKKEGRSFRLSLTPKFFEYFDVAGHEGIKEVLKDVKAPEKVGELQVVDLPPEEQKKIEEKGKSEGDKQKLGSLEVVDAIPEGIHESEEKETIDTIRPDNDYLSLIDEKIKELSKKNDELDQDESFKRPTDLGADLSAESGIEKAVSEGEDEEEKAEAKDEEEKTDAEKSDETGKDKAEEIEEREDEEGDEEADGAAESEEGSDEKDKKDEF